MAQGDVTAFDQWLVDVQEGLHDHELDTHKIVFMTSTQSLAATTADPRYGAGGTTNLVTNEVTPGGNYTAGGPTLANPTVTLTGGAGVFDGDDVDITQNASNPTNARNGVIYNDTDAGKRAVCYIDYGADTDMSNGDFSIAWNASGIISLNQA